MDKLVSLTPEQIARLPQIRDEWLSIGLRTGASDKEKAENGIRQAYSAAGLAEPKFFVWLDSPYRGAIGAAVLDQVGDQVRNQVGNQVRAQVGNQVRAQVWDQVRAQVRDQVLAQVWD